MILNQAAQAREEIALRLGAKRSRLGIIAGPMFTEGLFPHVFQRFNKTYPDVEITLKSGHFESHLHLLRSGDADLGFFIFDRPAQPDLAAEVLMEDQRVVVVAGVTHPLATRRRVSPQELWEQAWVLPDLVDHLFGTIFAECFARFGLPAPKPACELDTAEPQIRLIERGTHVGILSELVAREHVRAGRLCVIRTPDIYWPFTSRVLYRRGAPLSTAAQHFLDITRVVSREKAIMRRR
jgi:DNA-binding transcriptional LysR family regulator